MFDENGRYVIRNCQEKPAFSSFLPGIAGEMGVPVWCYYNNRGQGVCSFGVADKDHSILEFSPAHVAYREVARMGFRTFCKINGAFTELFARDVDMHIGMGDLVLTTAQPGLSAQVCYFGVPEERCAALGRILTLENTGSQVISLELLDGLAALVPYGVNQDMLKNMTQLSKAWMQVEDMDAGRAYFRVRASMADTAKVTKVEGGNFCLSVDGSGNLLRPIVQTALVFDQDTSLTLPKGFLDRSLDELCGLPQVTQNQYPCCFLPLKATLQPGEKVSIYSLYGQAEEKTRVAKLSGQLSCHWFEEKHRRCVELLDTLCAAVQTKTANPIFDAYCKQAYLDNFLRGGVPMFFRHEGKVKPFYLYSRKHGDPEREYNYFSLGREYYAQGNGNFRDVNQNRRCDVLFAPELGEENIHTFFDLIQADGYNPLVINASTYTLPEAERKKYPGLTQILSKPFTPGALAMAIEDQGYSREENLTLTARILCAAESEPNATFSEGYWCDHWTYNLDLIENFLAVYPEQSEALLFENRRYRYYESHALVNPRAKRYVMTEDGLRQYHALTERPAAHKWMHTADGSEARSTLIEKLILLGTIKTATLDAAGLGVEMEGGKPGWYDALNGLPGLLGSSMPESCELARLLRFTMEALQKRDGELEVYREVWNLAVEVAATAGADLTAYERWNRWNLEKEKYRACTAGGYSGARVSVSCREAASLLGTMEEIVLRGIQQATEIGKGVIPTYFSFDATKVAQTPDGPMPLELKAEPLPFFLEGPTRMLKLNGNETRKRNLAKAVKESDLYDETLHMYKVNASLEGVSFEVGRAKAFTPGWLENESIWLHMEYKYLLELLKSGLYAEFSQAFRDAAVPFLNPEVYGRSPLENVSFLASSANPDPKLHGRGFVARLSGSTVEFLHMWQVMFFGPEPFRVGKDGLELELRPFVPAYLMPENGCVQAAFLGSIPVTYEAGNLPALVPGVTQAGIYHLVFADGKEKTIQGPVLAQADAEAVRKKEVVSITVEMCNAPKDSLLREPLRKTAFRKKDACNIPQSVV